MTKREIISEITICATAQIVWEQLIDFDSYKEWNPFILSFSGNLVSGEKVNVRIKPKDSSVMNFNPIITKVDEYKEIRWKGKLFIKGLFDGEHYFKLIDNGDTTILIQGEMFSGIFIPFMKNMIEINTLYGFNEMNKGLKRQIENSLER